MIHPRLSVFHRLILITLIIGAVIAVAVTGLVWFAFQSGISQLEQTVTEDCADRLGLIIRAESETLRQTAYEWAILDETQVFLSHESDLRSHEFPDASVLQSLGITWLLLFDDTGTLRYSTGPDGINQTSSFNPDILGKSLNQAGIIGNRSILSPHSGLFRSGKEGYLMAVHPVSRPDTPDAPAGFVVTARILDKDTFSRMTSALPALVFLIPNNTDEEVSKDQDRIQYHSDTGVITTNLTLSDILNRPAFSAGLKIPFSSPYHPQMILTLISILGLGFVVYIIAIYYIFTRFFLRHLTNLGYGLEMAVWSTRSDPSSLSDLPPEIAPLAGSVSRVIDSLDDRQASLIRAEHARKSAEIRWETVFRSAAESILIGDEEGVLTCNPRFESLTGFRCEDLIGTPVSSLPFRSMVGDGSGTLQALWNTPRDEGVRFIWTITSGDEQTFQRFILDANIRFVEVNGRILRFLIMRDITQETRLAQQQEEALIQIDENMSQLAALNDEIRNPLTMISAWAEMDDSPNRDKILEGVLMINRIVDRVDQGYIASEKVRKYLQKSIDRFHAGSRQP